MKEAQHEVDANYYKTADDKHKTEDIWQKALETFRPRNAKMLV